MADLIVPLSDTAHKKFKKYATGKGVTMTSIVRGWIDRLLEDKAGAADTSDENAPKGKGSK